MELHDLPRKAQPDARAVGLGRVEGGKDIFGDLGRDRSPVVVELDRSEEHTSELQSH